MQRAILFDLEGVLVQLNRQYYIVDQVLRRGGIFLDVPKLYKLRGFGKYNVSTEFFKGLVAFYKFNINENLLLKENLEEILDNYVRKLSSKDLNLAKRLREKYKKLRYGLPIKIKEKLYPKTKWLLNILSYSYLLGLYTAREKQSTLDLLKALGIEKFFNVVFAGEMKRKIGLGPFVKICNSFNIPVNKSYIVGDSEVDIANGRKAGLRTILVLTGNGSIALQKRVKPDYTIDKVYGVLEVLKYDKSFSTR